MHPLIKSKRVNDPLGLRKRKIKRAIVSVISIGLTTATLHSVSQIIAPGQHQYNSYFETVSRDTSGYLHRDVIPLATVIFLTSGTSYTRPADWNDANNSIELIGGGQGGQSGVPLG